MSSVQSGSARPLVLPHIPKRVVHVNSLPPAAAVALSNPPVPWKGAKGPNGAGGTGPPPQQGAVNVDVLRSPTDSQTNAETRKKEGGEKTRRETLTRDVVVVSRAPTCMVHLNSNIKFSHEGWTATHSSDRNGPTSGTTLLQNSDSPGMTTESRVKKGVC